MEKKLVINASLVIVAVLLVGVFGLSVRLEASADKVTVLKVEGVRCSSCAAAIAKTLEAEKGVASVAVDEPAGLVTVGYDSKSANPEALAGRVTAAGFGSRVLTVQGMEEYRKTTGGANLPPVKRGCCCSTKTKRD